MKRILFADWLPERARWAYLARSRFPALFPQKRNSLVYLFGHIINPLVTKLVRSRWLDIGLVLFCVFIDLDFVSVHKNAKYPAILTSRLVNNADIFATIIDAVIVRNGDYYHRRCVCRHRRHERHRRHRHYHRHHNHRRRRHRHHHRHHQQHHRHHHHHHHYHHHHHQFLLDQSKNQSFRM